MKKDFLKKHFQKSSQEAKSDLPKQGLRFFLVLLLISLFVHLGSYVNLNLFIKHSHQTPQQNYIKMKFNDPNVRDIKPSDKDENNKRIVEVPLEKTEKPKDPKFKSFTDHQTEKETRVENRLERDKAADAGLKSQEKKPPAKLVEQKIKPIKPKLKIGSSDPNGLEFDVGKEQKEKYKALMPTKEEMAKVLGSGYQEYLDEDLAIGDRVDINTSEYRYMGYMTSMRKAIELVWNYPVEAARRGMQGEVGLEFVILKNGETRRIRVIKSSGYKILDDAIVEAIKLASPFSPLPDGLGKNRLIITGMFRYVLSSFLAGG